MSQPKYVLKAAQRIYKILKETPQYAEGRQNTRRRMKRLLDNPEYGRKFAQLNVEDQKRILKRVHTPFFGTTKQKQKMIFKDIDSALQGKKKRLAKYKKSRELGIRGGAGSPADRASRYASMNPDTRSEAWPGDESTEFWNQYKREMGYVR